MSVEGTTPAPVDRGQRRREKTRASLMAAARALIAEQGIDTIRINEITERADVGFGSFYNHFTDKDAIVSAVVQEAVGAQAASVEAVTARLDDPAEVMAVAHRHFVRVAATDPTWAWIVVRLEVTHKVLATALGPYAVRDIQAGLDSGRFTVPDLAVSLNAMGGALVGIMRLVLEGNAPERADELLAELVLRLLGVDPEVAAEVASRPFPD